ncbi:major facilitator superfamily domain-containing protein [Aspergillus undulatus]|uniref:major facilitator superfamily domain-containing protein n=1 Tax=Aspergillus undulatus TaxID=1810928 RepID=UPI003CCD2FB8
MQQTQAALRSCPPRMLQLSHILGRVQRGSQGADDGPGFQSRRSQKGLCEASRGARVAQLEQQGSLLGIPPPLSQAPDEMDLNNLTLYAIAEPRRREDEFLRELTMLRIISDAVAKFVRTGNATAVGANAVERIYFPSWVTAEALDTYRRMVEYRYPRLAVWKAEHGFEALTAEDDSLHQIMLQAHPAHLFLAYMGIAIVPLYSIALAVFLVAYIIFEIPANYFLKLMSPSKWFCLLMVSWGTSASCMGAIENFGGLIATRFILGVFEGGLAPGLAYYITFWYLANGRSIRLAFIYSTATLAGAFGGALAYGIFHLSMARGMEGWRWSLPSVVCAFIVLYFLPDYPEKSRFLTEEERQLALARMQFNGSKGTAGNLIWAKAKGTLCDLRLYAHYIVYFSKSCPFSSLSLFTHSIVKAQRLSDGALGKWRVASPRRGLDRVSGCNLYEEK